jgi:hypothetical protein
MGGILPLPQNSACGIGLKNSGLALRQLKDIVICV